ncbi:hypothetical protein Bca4012_065731 [Brassica carinata]
MGITLLLLYEKNLVIHGFIPAGRAPYYSPTLRVGLVVKKFIDCYREDGNGGCDGGHFQRKSMSMSHCSRCKFLGEASGALCCGINNGGCWKHTQMGRTYSACRGRGLDVNVANNAGYGASFNSIGGSGWTDGSDGNAQRHNSVPCRKKRAWKITDGQLNHTSDKPSKLTPDNWTN